jgi:hypothetical protein
MKIDEFKANGNIIQIKENKQGIEMNMPLSQSSNYDYLILQMTLLRIPSTNLGNTQRLALQFSN